VSASNKPAKIMEAMRACAADAAVMPYGSDGAVSGDRDPTERNERRSHVRQGEIVVVSEPTPTGAPGIEARSACHIKGTHIAGRWEGTGNAIVNCDELAMLAEPTV